MKLNLRPAEECRFSGRAAMRVGLGTNLGLIAGVLVSVSVQVSVDRPAEFMACPELSRVGGRRIVQCDPRPAQVLWYEYRCDHCLCGQ